MDYISYHNPTQVPRVITQPKLCQSSAKHQAFASQSKTIHDLELLRHEFRKRRMEQFLSATQSKCATLSPQSNTSNAMQSTESQTKWMYYDSIQLGWTVQCSNCTLVLPILPKTVKMGNCMPSLANCPRFNKYWSRQDLVKQKLCKRSPKDHSLSLCQSMRRLNGRREKWQLAIRPSKTLCATLIVRGEI